MTSNAANWSLVSWNVRGLADADKCKLVRDTLLTAKLNVACLQESKLRSIPTHKCRSFLPPNLTDFHFAESVGSRGGIVTTWDSRSLTASSYIARRHTLTSFFASTVSDDRFAVTNVYAPVDHRDSLHFLDDIRDIASHIQGSWVIAGDFNLTRTCDENNNGSFNQPLAQAFNDTIDDLGLIDIPLLDRLFTWSNHRASPTLARLDRVFFNNSMSMGFPNSSLTSLPKPTSDHTPILLTVSTSIPKPNLFRFENGWLKDRDFLPSVLPAWHRHPQGGAAGVLAGALKAVRNASKAWARSKRAPPSLHQNCKFVMYMFDVLEESCVLSSGELFVRQECQEKLAASLRARAAYWKQRGKQRAIREGDSNTQFFHAHASQRLRRNQIRALEVDGNTITSHEAKTAALTTHLRSLLGEVHATTWSFSLEELYAAAPTVSGEPLVAPFTEPEARAAVRAMNRNSSPGPDGFGPSFYLAAWDTVAGAVMELAHAFHREEVELERLNRAFVVMIPKHCAATRAGDYRPICLQNCSLKIVAKMLTTRLQAEIPRIIDVDQTGFIKGRSISENFIYAMELVQCCNKRRLPTLVLKLDFAKAFDSVNWDSLQRIMAVRGFPQLWCR